ncbi:MAG: class I SAM-dependent methyltransferase [Leptospiraceae bacterium]|nr:class I SAM-dependent methyltransferase [Leptospiraceae bacterium]MCP5502508.1 class I SAM-dependent methyltransferase [Leptospiraceae bacterium]
MYTIEKEILREKRHSLLSELKGDILEIGSGTGINFRYYPEEARVFALEPSRHMWKKATERMEKESPVAKIHPIISGFFGDKLPEGLEENSMDYIVSTLVLCTVPDPENSILQFKKILKPKGKLIILEHIRSVDSFTAMIQDGLNPVWSIVSEGCNFNRPTDFLLKQYGFVPLIEEYFFHTLPFYSASLVMS